MNKIASTKVAQVLSQVGPALRALAQENHDLREKLAHYQKRDRAEKIASEMETKQLNPGTSFQEKVAQLMQQDDLQVVEKAVELSAPQIKLAALTDEPGNAASAEDAFAAGIMAD